MTIPNIQSPPTAPSRLRPLVFSDEADAFVAWWEDTYDPEINASITEMNATAVQVDIDATQSGINAQTAVDAANSAASSANYVGVWDTLTGALSVPSSVLWNDEFWTLVEDLDGTPGNEVQDHEPAVPSTIWQPSSAAMLDIRVGTMLAGEVAVVADDGLTFEVKNFNVAVNTITSSIFFSMGV